MDESDSAPSSQPVDELSIEDLAQSEARWRAVLAGALDPIVTIDPYGTIQSANRACQAVFGYEAGQLIGQNIKLLMPEPFRSDHDQHLARYRETGQTNILGKTRDFPVLRQDGSLIECQLSVSRVDVPGQSEPLYCGSFRDVTDVKRAQQREISMMRAFADIGESAALLAHEIKTPITAVNSALRAVANKLGEDEQVVLSELVERMQKMESLMRRTLSLARPLEIDPARCEVAELFKTSAKLMQPHLEQDGIELEIAVARDCPDLQLDHQLIEEVLANLIRNSIDAMTAGGQIRLGAAVSGAGQRVVLRVDDSGPGIPENVLSTLFRPFVSTKASGTGLGLAIARKVVEAHGGTIAVCDSPLGGACFEIEFPVLS